MAGRTSKLDLPPMFNAASVESIHERMKALLSGSNPIYIDFSRCKGVDAAGLQLLVAFVTALQKENREFELAGIEGEVLEAIELGGFGPSIGLPSDKAVA